MVQETVETPGTVFPPQKKGVNTSLEENLLVVEHQAHLPDFHWLMDQAELQGRLENRVLVLGGDEPC